MQLFIGTFDQSLENVSLLKCLPQLFLGTCDQSLENASLPIGLRLFICTFDQSLVNVGLLNCLLQPPSRHFRPESGEREPALWLAAAPFGTFDQSLENMSLLQCLLQPSFGTLTRVSRT